MLPVFRCSCSFLFLFVVFQLIVLSHLVLCTILSGSLPAVLQDAMIYSAEVKDRFGYDQ